MKILHAVQSYYPAVSGMGEVVRQLSERLARAGHDVTVATEYDAQRKEKSVNNVQIEQFRITGNAVLGFGGTPGEQERYRSYLLSSNYDIIVFFAAQQWATDLALPILEQIQAKKVFVPTGFSGLYLPAYKDYFEQMESWMKQFDMNVFLSEDYRDINFAQKNGVNKFILIPNGAAEEEFLPPSKVNIRQILGISPTSFLILHVGAHTGLKGHSELFEIFDRAAITDATLLLIGNYLDRKTKLQERIGKVKDFVYLTLKRILIALHLKLNNPLICPILCRHIEKNFNHQPNRAQDHKQIIVRTLDRKITIAAYQQADIFLFPSNVECSPIVLFECMAAKLPFLASDVGNAREIIKWSEGGILLPTDQMVDGFSKVNITESAMIMQKLWGDEALRKRLGLAGFNSWRSRFTWEKISHSYEQLYFNLSNKK